jgi:hypothetical protein
VGVLRAGRLALDRWADKVVQPDSNWDGPRRRRTMRRRKLFAAILSVGALAIPVAPAVANPDFGPGNSSKGPNDAGAKCHPPGQTVNEPGGK